MTEQGTANAKTDEQRKLNIDVELQIMEERRRFISRILSMVSVSIAFGTVGFAVFGFYRAGVERLGADNSRSMAEINLQITKKIVALEDEISHTNDSLKEFTKIPEENKVAVKLQQIEKSITEIQSREANLEKAILANPQKALEIPLLQRDIENLRTTQQSNIQTIKDGVDRIYDLAKWLLGAMAVSIITLGIGNFLKEK